MDFSRWAGIQTILVTPFKDDFSLDLDGHRRNVEFAASSGAHVLICLGTQGEFSSLSTEERKLVMRITVEANAGRQPVICGTSHSSTQEAIELTRYAKEIGSDAIMVTPAYFAETNQQSQFDHFERIADAGQVPVFLYNAPARAGFNLTPQMLRQLAEHELIIGVKQATRNVTELEETVALAGDRLAVVGGSEAMIWPCLTLGMIGSTATTASALPGPFLKIYEAAQRNDLAAGLDLYMKLSEFRLLCKAAGHAAVVKAMMDFAGLAGGPVRPPLPQMTDRQKAEARRIMTEMQQL